MDTQGTTQTAILGGGCFWCTEAVFRELRGVRSVTSGYAGDLLERHRALEQFPFIRKPFRRADLAQRLRPILLESEGS